MFLALFTNIIWIILVGAAMLVGQIMIDNYTENERSKKDAEQHSTEDRKSSKNN